MKLQLDTEIDNLIENKLKQYDRVLAMFGEFFNAEALGQIIDRKADIELI